MVFNAFLIIFDIRNITQWAYSFNGTPDTRAYLRGEFRGFNPPRNFQIFFWKSEGKKIERKKKRDVGGGGLPLNIFLELIFSGGLRNFRGGLRNFQWELRNFRGG